MAGIPRTDDDLRVLRWIASRDGVTLPQVKDEFAARMGRERASRAVSRLRGADHLALEATLYRATAAGKERIAAAPPAGKLPVLPTPFTPYATFACARLGTHLSVEQCAGRWAVRGDDPCGRGAGGELAEDGCPVGAAAKTGLDEYRQRGVRKASERKRARAAA